jgi:hypothetical protein
MVLNIFVPDLSEIKEKKFCVPLLYPFLSKTSKREDMVNQYGEWINNIKLVNDIRDCHIVVPAFYINYYYNNHIVSKLKSFNEQPVKILRLTVCWTNGDWGITPDLKNFHLYRNGGYLSKIKEMNIVTLFF